MIDLDTDKLQKVASGLWLMGETKAIQQVQKMLMPHIMGIFSDHGHEDLERYILTDYPLVEKQTPEGVRNVLHNLGSNPEIRQQWEGTVLQYVTPENIKEWLRTPDEWLDEEEADEQREELRKCAEVIEETPGGEEWLERQVLTLYQMAHIVPEDTNPARADD